mgnify:CR=1 FL=1
MKPANGRITQGFSTGHQAIDYGVGIGSQLFALKAGVITDMPNVSTRRLMGNLNNTQHWPEARTGQQNSGNVITIDHGGGEFTSYLHVSPYDVNSLRGRRVNRGDVIGLSGHNGWSTGPHLHFEVWQNGSRINPEPWINNLNKEVPVAKLGIEGARILAYHILGVNGVTHEHNALNGTVDGWLKRDLVNLDLNLATIRSLYNSKQSIDFRKNLKKLPNSDFVEVSEKLYKKKG